MKNTSHYTRPTFDEALKVWQSLLSQRGLPTELIWVFDENLCFESAPSLPGGFRLGYQLAFTPPPPDAGRIAYQHFVETESRLVFYRIGSAQGKSVCVLLCDPWFEAKTEADGFGLRNDWLMSFRPGGPEEIAEVKDQQQWRNRILRDRPLHDLDFCMTLQSMHEILAHGRLLSTYERYALKFLHAWHRLLGQPE
jgi:hypothetical protein